MAEYESMIVLKIALKLVVFLVMLFAFMSLYQHGPGGFVEGMRGEVQWAVDLFASSGGGDTASKPKTND